MVVVVVIVKGIIPKKMPEKIEVQVHAIGSM